MENISTVDDVVNDHDRPQQTNDVLQPQEFNDIRQTDLEDVVKSDFILKHTFFLDDIDHERTEGLKKTGAFIKVKYNLTNKDVDVITLFKELINDTSVTQKHIKLLSPGAHQELLQAHKDVTQYPQLVPQIISTYWSLCRNESEELVAKPDSTYKYIEQNQSKIFFHIARMRGMKKVPLYDDYDYKSLYYIAVRRFAKIYGENIPVYDDGSRVSRFLQSDLHAIQIYYDYDDYDEAIKDIEANRPYVEENHIKHCQRIVDIISKIGVTIRNDYDQSQPLVCFLTENTSFRSNELQKSLFKQIMSSAIPEQLINNDQEQLREEFTTNLLQQLVKIHKEHFMSYSFSYDDAVSRGVKAILSETDDIIIVFTSIDPILHAQMKIPFIDVCNVFGIPESDIITT
jgi:hypothetical protein